MVKVIDTSYNKGNTPNGQDNASANKQDNNNDNDNDDDNSPELDAPFIDPDLQALWTTAVK